MPIWRKAVDRRPAKGDVDLILKIDGRDHIGRYVKEYDYFKMEPDFGHMFWPRDVEYLDETEPSFTIHQMRDAWEDGTHNGRDVFGYTEDTFKTFMKEQYNITDIWK